MQIVEQPLVIIYRAGPEPTASIVTAIHPDESMDHRGYGLIICDLVRHVANVFKVEEDDVWEWVDKERHHHTTDITNPS